MSEIEAILKQDGPTRAAALAEKLATKTGIKAEAARQRLARARPPIRKYPRSLLPKREGFFYLEEQRNTERYWSNLLRDLRATGSIYGLAIDAFMARGGIVPQDEFAVISGAPLALKGQIPTEGVAKMLVDLGVVAVQDLTDLGPCYVANEYAVAHPEPTSVIRTRSLVEGVILDGLREWVRKNGFASYDKIAIRGEDHPRMVGQFKWDLTGPSYLLPLRGPKSQNGFFVADVFSDIRMDAEAARYFIRKAVLYRQTSRSGDILPLLMAESFTGEALTLCHKAGIIPCTPSNLFGNKVGGAIMALTATLKHAAGIAINNPEKLYTLLDSLSEIEGAAGNMRGILFELIAVHLAKKTFGGGVEMGISAKHAKTGESADIDVQCVTEDRIRLIECKGRAPGGTVALSEVEHWLKKLPVFQNHLSRMPHLSERPQEYMIWTTGTFEPDAITFLEAEKLKRTKRPISWKDGSDVRQLARDAKLKVLGKALDEHFLRHPLST